MNLTRESLLERVAYHTALGHAKRDAAFVRQVSLACSCPVTSLAQAAGQASNSTMADLMSLYRFVDNNNVSVSQLREIRSAVVLESIPAEEELLIVHRCDAIGLFAPERQSGSAADRRPSWSRL